MFTKKAWEYNSTAKQFKEYYKDKEPLAVMGISNVAGIAILDIVYGIDDLVIIRGCADDLHKYKTYYDAEGRAFFNYGKCRYFLDEFMRTNI